MALLRILTGLLAGKTVELDGEPVVVGRHHECQIRVLDDAVSRRHAQITCQGNRFFVADLGSRNGTYLNGDRIHVPKPLHQGDRVQLGSTILEVQ